MNLLHFLSSFVIGPYPSLKDHWPNISRGQKNSSALPFWNTSRADRLVDIFLPNLLKNLFPPYPPTHITEYAGLDLRNHIYLFVCSIFGCLFVPWSSCRSQFSQAGSSSADSCNSTHSFGTVVARENRWFGITPFKLEKPIPLNLNYFILLFPGLQGIRRVPYLTCMS